MPRYEWGSCVVRRQAEEGQGWVTSCGVRAHIDGCISFSRHGACLPQAGQERAGGGGGRLF